MEVQPNHADVSVSFCFPQWSHNAVSLIVKDLLFLLDFLKEQS